MKVEDYLKSKVVVKPPYMGRVASMMVTYERPGLLTKTVASYMASHNDPPPLVVFDDGSTSDEKIRELAKVRNMGAIVMEMKHTGFIDTWEQAFEWAHRMFLNRAKGLVLLEDDITFAKGWLDVLMIVCRKRRRSLPDAAAIRISTIQNGSCGFTLYRL